MRRRLLALTRYGAVADAARPDSAILRTDASARPLRPFLLRCIGRFLADFHRRSAQVGTVGLGGERTRYAQYAFFWS